MQVTSPQHRLFRSRGCCALGGLSLSLLLVIGCGSPGGRKVEPLAKGSAPRRSPRLYVAKDYSPATPDVAAPRPGTRRASPEVAGSELAGGAVNRVQDDMTAERDRTASDSQDSRAEATPTQPGRPEVLETVPNHVRPVTPAPSDEAPPAPATQPAEEPGEPYHLNVNQIMHLVYRKSPIITSSRESMNAAQHALTEFRANLSRREPFMTATGDYSLFPERRDSEGIAGETTGGVEIETFDGALIRLEGGVRGERVQFGEVSEGQDDVEAGSGGVVRARIEVPFAGSRIRQNRVINQAFQESSARKAVIDYVSRFRSYVEYALTYYDAALYYRDYVLAYQNLLDQLNALTARPNMKPADLVRIESVAGDTRVLIEGYQTSYRSYLLLLLESLGLGPEDAYVLDERPLEDASRYYDLALTDQGRREMVEEAFENNMQFRVLADAIADSKLKRQQALDGKLDITTFIDGTQFAFGSESFDDRVGGWLVQGGVTVRVNDPRVLTASREKAEAEIRQFEAEILAEKLRVQRQVIEESTVLASYHESRPKVLENLEKARDEYEQRAQAYFSGSDETLSIDDVLTSLSSITVAETRLASNIYYSRLSEDELLTATGEVYRRVGLEIDEQAGGRDAPPTSDHTDEGE
jgi:hypothetical protein